MSLVGWELGIIPTCPFAPLGNHLSQTLRAIVSWTCGLTVWGQTTFLAWAEISHRRVGGWHPKEIGELRCAAFWNCDAWILRWLQFTWTPIEAWDAIFADVPASVWTQVWSTRINQAYLLNSASQLKETPTLRGIHGEHRWKGRQPKLEQAWNNRTTCTQIFESFLWGSSSSYGGTVLRETISVPLLRQVFLDGTWLTWYLRGLLSPHQALPSSAALPLTDDLARASLGLIFTARLFPSDLVYRLCLSYLMLVKLHFGRLEAVMPSILNSRHSQDDPGNVPHKSRTAETQDCYSCLSHSLADISLKLSSWGSCTIAIDHQMSINSYTWPCPQTGDSFTHLIFLTYKYHIKLVGWFIKRELSYHLCYPLLYSI